jgi:hypothetical protein
LNLFINFEPLYFDLSKKTLLNGCLRTTTQHVISELTGTNENLTVQNLPFSETSPR